MSLEGAYKEHQRRMEACKNSVKRLRDEGIEHPIYSLSITAEEHLKAMDVYRNQFSKYYIEYLRSNDETKN